MLADLLEPAIVISVLAAALRIATPILLAALGEVVAERAGVYNMGLEGTMLIGAFVAYFVTFQTGLASAGLLAAAASGALVSLLFAFMVVTLQVEQIVTGLAINLLGAGLSTYALRAAFADAATVPAIGFMPSLPLPWLAGLPVLGPILFEQKLLTYLALLAVPAVAWFLFRTRMGLELRCIGENPKALDTKGLSVPARQYGALLFGGVMAGLGGAFLSVGSAARFVPDMTNGRGWLALVIVIAGAWRPWRILAAALAFSLLDALQLQIQGVGLKLPFQLLLALPYICAILAMILLRPRAGVPAMLGVAYRREDVA